MTYLRPFRCDDLFKFNNVNLDPLTETYGVNFYLQYLARWPEYFQVAESPTGEIMGYIMGKAEGREELWHGHVTAVTVAPEYRRLGLAGMLMKSLEDISESKDCYFVDLFVRVSNRVAVDMYHKLGYIIYRRVLDYYSGDPDEDAFAYILYNIRRPTFGPISKTLGCTAALGFTYLGIARWPVWWPYVKKT